MNLRSKLIRLAHTNPELRPHLLAILKEGAHPYDVSIDHGYTQPLAGAHDVMQQLQSNLLVEQGRPPRPENHHLASNKVMLKNTDLRNPYYALSDASGAFARFAEGDGDLRKDKKLIKLLKSIEDLVNDLSDHLNATYDKWD
jgi:hypothetical protein